MSRAKDLKIDGKGALRRDFLKKAAIGSLAFATTAGVAKKVVSVATETDVKKAYLNDILPGDSVLKNREYVVMTDAEKKQMVKMFTENHKKQSL